VFDISRAIRMCTAPPALEFTRISALEVQTCYFQIVVSARGFECGLKHAFESFSMNVGRILYHWISLPIPKTKTGLYHRLNSQIE
jgi:hypothetical protein